MCDVRGSAPGAVARILHVLAPGPFCRCASLSAVQADRFGKLAVMGMSFEAESGNDAAVPALRWRLEYIGFGRLERGRVRDDDTM